MKKSDHLYEVSQRALETTPELKPLTYEYKRLILDKLNDVYLNEKEGYSADWTDRKVADDLGCPLAWVTQLREVNFGPHGSNVAIDHDIIAATRKIEECRTMAAKLLATADEEKAMAQKLSVMAEDLEKRLQTIQKALRP